MKAKPEPPLHLEMSFGEAVARFSQTKPEEVAPPKGKKHKAAKATKRLVEHAKARPESYGDSE